MKEIVKLVNFFRNLCAHEEVLITYELDSRIKKDIFCKYFKDQEKIRYYARQNNLFLLILLLKLIFKKEDYIEFISNLESILNKYENEFQSVEFSEILKLAGFPTSWKNFIYDSL